MKLSIIVSVFFLFGNYIYAQPQEGLIREQTGGNPILFEGHYIVGDSLHNVIVPFRVRYDFFVFVRNSANTNGQFQANGEITIELIDSTETSVARAIQQINLSSENNTPSHLRTQSAQNVSNFNLPSGTYKIIFKIEDKESKRQYVDNKRTIDIPKKQNILSSLIPAEQNNDHHFVPINLGGDIQFSKNYGFVFLAAKKYQSATYSLNKLSIENDEKEAMLTNNAVQIVSHENTIFSLQQKEQTLDIHLTEQQNVVTHYIALNGKQLRQGRYEILFTFPDSTKIKTTFNARWLDMPTSLFDLDVALEPIQYITTKDEYSILRKGGRETRIKKFEEFWKKKDATLETAYNEVMHEFYRRVDYAFVAFRSLKELNGALTDRGKIYILYGKPSSIDRLLNPGNAPKEIWKYDSFNKVFTFEDPTKQGNYKLAENK